MENIRGYAKLTKAQKELFEKTYEAHLAMMGEGMRKKYGPEQLKEIKWDREENCLKVYWKGDTDWFHYRIKGMWD